MNTEQLTSRGFQIISEGNITEIMSLLQEKYEELYISDETILTPNKTAQKHTTTLSSKYGYNEFPFHTDGAHFVVPPRWIILEYLGDTISNSATLIVDVLPFTKKKEYDNLFYNEIYSVVGGREVFLTSIINNIVHPSPIFRWNPIIMQVLNKKSKVSFEDLQFDHIDRIIWHPKKVLVLDNWRVMHGREKISATDSNQRILKRYNLIPKNRYASI